MRLLFVIFIGTIYYVYRWVLRLENTQVRDDGTYECQVTTAVKTSSYVHLKVLGK